MNRVVIIGCGNVGLSYLHKLCLTDMSLDISLIDLDEEKVIGEILDIEQSLIYRNSTPPFFEISNIDISIKSLESSSTLSAKSILDLITSSI